MIINHNLSALNTYRKQQQNAGQAVESIKKLSAGMRITQAADDSAGLAISEKMRGQIRGLEKVKQNVTDGISLINVAEGAMEEVNEILLRMRELAVQAANDTYTESDRKIMQREIEQLTQEIESISANTEFNTIILLTGDVSKGTAGIAETLTQYVQSITSDGINDRYSYIDGTGTVIEYASAVIDFSNILSASDVQDLVGKGVHYTCTTCTQKYSIKFVDGSPDASKMVLPNPILEVDVSSITNGTDLTKAIVEAGYGEAGYRHDPVNPKLPATAPLFVEHFSQLGYDGAKLYIYDNRPSQTTQTWPDADGHGVFQPTVYNAGESEKKSLELFLQIGSNEGQNIKIDIPNITVGRLGLAGLSVETQSAANTAISTIDSAINIVTSSRADLGVLQNRLEYAYRNAANYQENITASESRIRDLDMAKEITNLSKSQIILQSSQAMTAQANQVTQGILQLLK